MHIRLLVVYQLATHLNITLFTLSPPFLYDDGINKLALVLGA